MERITRENAWRDLIKDSSSRRDLLDKKKKEEEEKAFKEVEQNDLLKEESPLKNLEDAKRELSKEELKEIRKAQIELGKEFEKLLFDRDNTKKEEAPLEEGLKRMGRRKLPLNKKAKKVEVWLSPDFLEKIEKLKSPKKKEKKEKKVILGEDLKEEKKERKEGSGAKIKGLLQEFVILYERDQKQLSEIKKILIQVDEQIRRYASLHYKADKFDEIQDLFHKLLKNGERIYSLMKIYHIELEELLKKLTPTEEMNLKILMNKFLGQVQVKI
jgi:microtubule-associated protein 1